MNFDDVRAGKPEVLEIHVLFRNLFYLKVYRLGDFVLV
jgi:hypothetical protein